MSKDSIMEVFKIFESLTNYISVAVPFIFLLVGLGLIVLNRYRAFKLKRRKNINVEATIVKSELFQLLSSNSDSTSVMYRPAIEYTYSIEEYTYHSTCIAYFWDAFATNDKQQMESLIRQYPVGQMVSAFVNGEDFSDAYLLDKSPNEWVGLTVGCVFIVLSIVSYGLFS